MRYWLFILLIGCNVARRTSTPAYHTIILDGSKSKIINGDGKGYFKHFQWRQIQGTRFPIENPESINTTTKVISGSYAWEITGVDNLGNAGKDTVYIKIK
jgi:hypothetical protein